jgi:hypothetical protein
MVRFKGKRGNTSGTGELLLVGLGVILLGI